MKYYITTAIAYTSRKPHVGNVYEIVLTDTIARYRRLKGDDVFFLTGTDEHGQKIGEIAADMGIEPQAYVDKISSEIKDIWNLLNTSYDKFIRTTDSYHEKTVQQIFKKLYEQGDIYKGEYEGNYCVPCESFFTETQLVDGKCPDCGREVKKTKEEAYFLRMSKYQDRLMKHIEENPDFITPEARKKEMINNFIKPGLQDLCVSRTSFKWGIPVDFDDKHVVYVWIDALSNYITALGYNPDGENGELYNKYWPANVHIIGKDILRFHTIYWPIILMALDIPLPKQIFGHPWMLFGKDKMSKSKGNVIYADELVKFFGVDAVRYYMISQMPFAQDGNITYETIISTFNSDLANTLGNLVNRTVAMCKKYFDGNVVNTKVNEPVDNEIFACAKESLNSFNKCMETFHVADAVEAVFDLARRLNKYIDETTPWVLAKDESTLDRLKTVLYILIEGIRQLAIMLTPFMPETSNEIFKQINTKLTSIDSINDFNSNDITCVGEPKPLFNRIDEAKMLEEIKLAKEQAVSDEKKEDKIEGIATIGIEDFSKVKLTVCKVLNCEEIKKSDKLLKFTLDDGSGVNRQVVSGIKKWYSPTDLIGKNLIVVTNLAPIKLRGEDSNGMILSAESFEGDKEIVTVLTVDENIKSGANIR